VTGRRRRTGWLDCVMLRKAVRINSLTEIALTKLDVLDTFPEVKVCTEYDADGRPVYAVMDGWRRDISDVRSRADLPRQAADFVALVESEVGVPVRIVGTGPSREAVLEWQ
jgi:adenylosuccinate synthase